MDEPTYIVCSPATSPAHVKGSVERWCTICAVAVWMAPSSVKFHAGSDASPVCIECARRLAKFETTASIEPVPGSDAEWEVAMTPAEHLAALRAAASRILPPDRR